MEDELYLHLWVSTRLPLHEAPLFHGVSACHLCSTILLLHSPVTRLPSFPHLALFPQPLPTDDDALPLLSITLNSGHSSVLSKTPSSPVECPLNPRSLFPSSARSEFSAQRTRQRGCNVPNTFMSSSEPYSTLRKRIARRVPTSEQSILKAITSPSSRLQLNRRSFQSSQVTKFR